MTALDPSIIRLSRSILLSDAVKCDSIVRLGLPNPIYAHDTEKILEGTACAEFIEDVMTRQTGYSCSITYGYLDKWVSDRIVRHVKAGNAHYHTWNDGAAMDVIFHPWVFRGREHFITPADANQHAPIRLAAWIDIECNYSRLITYAESEGLCIATKVEDARRGTNRNAFYENRVQHDRQPEWIQRSRVPAGERLQESMQLYEHIGQHLQLDWRGRGWPRYHGGGRRQYQHIRTGFNSVLLDWLYDVNAVHHGWQNQPPKTKARKRVFWRLMWAAVTIHDELHDQFSERFSIVNGYCRSSDRPWDEVAQFELVPAFGIDIDAVIDFLHLMSVVDKVERLDCDNGVTKLRVTTVHVDSITQFYPFPSYEAHIGFWNPEGIDYALYSGSGVERAEGEGEQETVSSNGGRRTRPPRRRTRSR